jgi:hypothetical protein
MYPSSFALAGQLTAWYWELEKHLCLCSSVYRSLPLFLKGLPFVFSEQERAFKLT